MSFSSEMKTALAAVHMSDCCAHAALYGMLLFGRTSSHIDLSLLTEHEPTATCYAKLLRRLFDCRVVVEESGKTRKRYKATVSGEPDNVRIMNTYLYQWKGNFDSLNLDLVTKECCMASFLRGVFLACGTMSDPEKEYRLDFAVKNNNLAVDLYGLLYRRGLHPYLSTRGKYVMVYIKKSEDIQDFLALIEAPRFSLEFMSMTVVKDIRNNENRRNNFETANIAKTAGAVAAQLDAIEKLKNSGKWGLIPEQIRLVAEVRDQNPDASLTAMLDLLQQKGITLTKSGLNHRLQKLIALANE